MVSLLWFLIVNGVIGRRGNIRNCYNSCCVQIFNLSCIRKVIAETNTTNFGNISRNWNFFVIIFCWCANINSWIRLLGDKTLRNLWICSRQFRIFSWVVVEFALSTWIRTLRNMVQTWVESFTDMEDNWMQLQNSKLSFYSRYWNRSSN